MGKLIKLSVDGTQEVIFDNITSDEVNKNWAEYSIMMKKALNSDIECVHVLYNDKRTSMFVDEIGTTNWKKGYPLPVNNQANEIYHNAWRKKGRDWEGEPSIHGDAFLFEDIVIK